MVTKVAPAIFVAYKVPVVIFMVTSNVRVMSSVAKGKVVVIPK